MYSIREYYMDCLFYEERVLSHYIRHLLQEGKISLDDDVSKLDIDQADHKKVAEMIEQNVLCFRPIQIYSLKMDKFQFAFIFAESRKDAIELFIKLHKKKPMNCLELFLDEEWVRGNEVISFRDMRKEYSKFPALVGYYDRRYPNVIFQV